MIKIIGAVCLGKEPRIYGVSGQILVLAVSISILCILAVFYSKISLYYIGGAVQVQKRTQGKVEPKGKEEAAKLGPTTPSPFSSAPAAAASFFPSHE